MAQILALHWWALALRGLVSVPFGLIAFLIPVATLYALTILLGAYTAVRSATRHEHWWALLFERLAGLAAATAVRPLPALCVLHYIIAAWAFMTGIFKIAAATRLRRFISSEWLLAVTGAVSIIFGILLFSAPGPGVIVIAWWTGACAFVFGLLMIGLAFRLRPWPGVLRPAINMR